MMDYPLICIQQTAEYFADITREFSLNGFYYMKNWQYICHLRSGQFLILVGVLLPISLDVLYCFIIELFS